MVPPQPVTVLILYPLSGVMVKSYVEPAFTVTGPAGVMLPPVPALVWIVRVEGAVSTVIEPAESPMLRAGQLSEVPEKSPQVLLKVPVPLPAMQKNCAAVPAKPVNMHWDPD